MGEKGEDEITECYFYQTLSIYLNKAFNAFNWITKWQRLLNQFVAQKIYQFFVSFHFIVLQNFQFIDNGIIR